MTDPLTNAHRMAEQLASERDRVSFALVLAACALSAMCREQPDCSNCVMREPCVIGDGPMSGVAPEDWLTWLTREGSEADGG